MRTAKEIKNKLTRIEKERKTIRQYSMFGDNNWGTMDKQIEVLRNVLNKKIDPDDELEEMKDYYNDNFPEEQIEKSKMDALDWVLGNTDEL